MEYKNFEEFLAEKCFEENPSVLDDDMPDFEDNWVGNLDISDVIVYADAYANFIKNEIRTKVLELTK